MCLGVALGGSLISRAADFGFSIRVQQADDPISPQSSGRPGPVSGRMRPALGAGWGRSRWKCIAHSAALDVALIDPKSYRAPGACGTRRQSHDRVAQGDVAMTGTPARGPVGILSLPGDGS